MFDIIDAHCHIYPPAVAPKAVAAVSRFYGGLPEVRHEGTPDELLRSGAADGVRHFIVHSVATNPRQVPSINRFLAESVAASGGRFTGLGTLHPDSGDPEGDFSGLRALGLKGVKLHPDIQGFRVDSPPAMRIFEMCEAAGLPVCVHTGDHRFDLSNPPRVANVLRAFPRLKFIGAHFGGWSVWDEAARTLADFPNMVVDSSSTFYAVGPEKALELIRAWTPGRILFGTDYPLWTRQPDVDFLMKLALAEEDYEKIFRRNAAALFGIASGGKEDSLDE